MKNSFYNTTNEKGAKLTEYEGKASRQEKIILDWFKKHRSKKGYTPYEVWGSTGGRLLYPPLTSIRRAMTNLSDNGLLEKLEEKRVGGYGRLTHCWRLNLNK